MSKQKRQYGPTPELVNFAWTLLVSLSLYLQENPRSEMQQHMHIMRWLGNARKRHLFPKSLAAEIDWFIAEGKRRGPRAGLRAKAEYIWHTATGATRQQSDLRRLSFFINAVKRMGWQDRLVSDAEWLNIGKRNHSSPTVWLRKSELNNAFDVDESMNRPISLRLSQPWEGIKLIAEDCFLLAEPAIESKDDCHYVLTNRV